MTLNWKAVIPKAFFFLFSFAALIAVLGQGSPSSERGTIRKNSIGMEFVYIGPGEFMMGSKTGDVNETPIHRVAIKNGFWIGKFEVTQAQWLKVMGLTLRQQRDKSSIQEAPIAGEGSNFPIYYVSWNDSNAFVAKLNALNDGLLYKLPSEAEWEFAARAGSTGDYYGPVNDIAWYDINSGGSAHPVGQKLPNKFGLYDMSGNVWEWCEDIWSDNYEGLPTDGSANMNQKYYDNRVLRGGSWSVSSNGASSVSRTNYWPGGRYPSLGFRVVAIQDDRPKKAVGLSGRVWPAQ